MLDKQDREAMDGVEFKTMPYVTKEKETNRILYFTGVGHAAMNLNKKIQSLHERGLIDDETANIILDEFETFFKEMVTETMLHAPSTSAGLAKRFPQNE